MPVPLPPVPSPSPPPPPRIHPPPQESSLSTAPGPPPVPRGLARYQPLQRFQSTLALSPDGRHVAYSSNAGGQYNLYRQPVEGGEPVRLTDWTEQAVREVAWSPDGDRIAFTADRHGDEFHQVYLVPAAGGPVQQCTDAPKVQHDLGMVDAFSPDGRLLAYAGNDRTPT